MNNQVTISKENILNAYNQASGEQKALLENMFGKDMFHPQDIKERIKTFEDAVAILGDEHPLVAQFRVIESSFKEADNNLHLFAYARLVIIAEALNEGWKPKFDGDECRYYPWFYIYTKKEYDELDEDEKKECRVVGRSNYSAFACGGGLYANASYASSIPSSYNGSRLVFKTRELAEYCGKQFIDIWEKFLFA